MDEKELQEKIVAKQKAVLEEEIKTFEKNLEVARTGKSRMEEQWAVDKEIYEIMLAGYRTAQPKMQFEENERYWELQRKKLDFKFTQDCKVQEDMMTEYDNRISTMEEEIKKANDKLKEMEA